MITPSFSCSQSNTSVVLTVYVPAVRAADVEIHVDGSLVSVHINPYFLRLTLPGRVLEDDASSAQYDPSSGKLTLTLTKEAPGVEFADLDILAKLLAPRKPDPPVQPVIEVLSSENEERKDTTDMDLARATQSLCLEQRTLREAAENDWQFPQQLPPPLPTLHTTVERHYGFLNMHTGFFRHVAHTENEVNELGLDVETLPEEERRITRLKHEEDKFDEDYYMADFAEDEYIMELIAYKYPPHAPGSLSGDESLQFTDDENLTMLRLPQKEYLPSPGQTHALYLTLLTILFSHAYDARTTQHDPTPESAWTICSLTPAFSALDPPPYSHLPHPSNPSPQTQKCDDANVARNVNPTQPSTPSFPTATLLATLTPSIRRALSFPLYRSFPLAATCIHDIARILCTGGKRGVLRALLSVKRILDAHDVYYVYSKIWVEDFCVWVAKDAGDDILKSVGHTLKRVQFDKKEVGGNWDLEALENAVMRQMGRVSDSDDESVDSDG